MHAGTSERTGEWDDLWGVGRGCEYVRGNLFFYTRMYICLYGSERRVRETGEMEKSRFGIRVDDKKICMDLFD